MSTPSDLANPQEAGSLAREMFRDFRDHVEMYEKWNHLTRQEAVQKALDYPEHLKEQVLKGPANEVDWFGLSQVGETDPEAAMARWQEIQHEALNELQSGHRVAATLEGGRSSPWQRARFLALRHELCSEWQPTNGIERQLVDTMALAQWIMLDWTEALATRGGFQIKEEQRDVRETGRWQPARVSDHEAVEQAAAMVDRYNKIFLRTLRALRDLRRYSQPVIVQNAGQVNVAGQQINVNATSNENQLSKKNE